MITWSDGHPVRLGDASLIEQWRSDPAAYLWIDLDHGTENQAATLAEFGADEVVLEQSLAVRYPPKIEALGDNLVFMLLRGLDAKSTSIDFGTIQIAFLIGERYLVTRTRLLPPSSGCRHSYSEPGAPPDIPRRRWQ